MYKASKNLEFWGYRGQPFPGVFFSSARSSGGSFVCPSVCLFVIFLNSSINLNNSCSDLSAYITAVSQQSISCLSAVFQLSFSCLSAVFQLSFSCLSVVFQLSFSCLSAVPQLSLSCLSAIHQPSKLLIFQKGLIPET